MERCYICQDEAIDCVYNSDGTENYFLCGYCIDRFECCNICGNLVQGEELAENGLCDKCNEEN